MLKKENVKLIDDLVKKHNLNVKMLKNIALSESLNDRQL